MDSVPGGSPNVRRIVSFERTQERPNIYPGALEPKRIGGGFFRGENCNFTPQQRDFDRDGFITEFLLKDWTPERKLISRATKVTAFGSCFAENITKHLGALGYNLSKDRAPMIYVSRMSEGMVNTYAILQQLQWALENVKPPENLWHGYDCEQFGYDEEIRKATERVFLESEIFVITLGLSEIWYDEASGGIFWRAVPRKFYDPSRHKFRVCSFAETKNNVQKMYDLIREHVPSAKVVFTLSPIPLAATFRRTSVITANSASKAILRAALDEFYRDNSRDVNQNLFYFPSYEIVNDLFQDKFMPDFRHPHSHIISFILKLFEAVYCEGGPTLEEMDILFRQARHVKDIATISETVPRTFSNLLSFLRGRLINTRLCIGREAALKRGDRMPLE